MAELVEFHCLAPVAATGLDPDPTPTSSSTASVKAHWALSTDQQSPAVILTHRLIDTYLSTYMCIHTHALAFGGSEPYPVLPGVLTGQGVPEDLPHHPSVQLSLVVPLGLLHPGKKTGV